MTEKRLELKNKLENGLNIIKECDKKFSKYCIDNDIQVIHDEKYKYCNNCFAEAIGDIEYILKELSE